jgi:hypothetical protein
LPIPSPQQPKDWYDELMRRVPSQTDPYLERLTERDLGFIRAGLSLFKPKAYEQAGEKEEARRQADAFAELVPFEVYEMVTRTQR